MLCQFLILLSRCEDLSHTSALKQREHVEDHKALQDALQHNQQLIEQLSNLYVQRIFFASADMHPGDNSMNRTARPLKSWKDL